MAGRHSSTSLHDTGGFRDVGPLLEPGSVVVVGASERPGNLGGRAVEYLRKFGFPGDVWAVNPRAEPVFGAPCVATLRELPQLRPPALAILAVPAESTVELIEECTDVGIRHGVIWSGGFADAGAAGASLSATLVDTCERTGFTVAGPNCLGIIAAHVPMTATFSSFLSRRDELDVGRLSIITQSGGVGTILQTLASEAGHGFRVFVSSGNEAQVSASDYVHGLANDPGTDVIALYLEGVRDGPAFLDALDAARRRGTHVAVLKAGRSPATVRAAVAHTGALVGEDAVWTAMLAEHGALRVDTIEQLADTSLFLSVTPSDSLPRGDRVGIVTFGGGLGVLAADGCALNGLSVPELSPSTVATLRELVPPTASVDNPVDLTPAAFGSPYIERLPEVLAAVARDERVDVLQVQYGGTWLDGRQMAEAAKQVHDDGAAAVVVVWPSAPPGAVDRVRESGLYCFEDYARAAAVVGALARRTSNPPPPRPSGVPAFDWAAHVEDVELPMMLSEPTCAAILRDAGVAMAPGQLARTTDEAVAAAQVLGHPVALKGVTGSISHRARAGLVRLGASSEDDIRAGVAALQHAARGLGVELEGVYVQRMVESSEELLVTATRDPVFGPTVAVGSGGTRTEELDDVAVTRAPVLASVAADLLGRTAAGQRCGLPAAGPDHPAAQFVARFSELAASAPWDRFAFELNPVLVTEHAAVAVDALLEIAGP